LLFIRQERDRLRIEKQDPLNHMSKYVDELKRKRDDEPKPTKKVSTSSSSSSPHRHQCHVLNNYELKGTLKQKVFILTIKRKKTIEN